MKGEFLLLLLFLVSCDALFPSSPETDIKHLKADGKESRLAIVFSHNINGETHPCGCRNNPLGGLAQVAGKLYELRSKNPVIYVDTGDTFFPSIKIPSHVESSTKLAAETIAKSLSELKIDFYLPGERDFAFGKEYLLQLLQKNKIKTLVSNLKEENGFSKNYAHLTYGERNFFFLGVVPKELTQTGFELLSPLDGIQKTLTQIQKKYPDHKNATYILLSHLGMSFDQELAKKFPGLNWIIGSHDQAFSQRTVDVGNTKIVQVLSRNHYLGQINFTPGNDAGTYELIEVRDELKDLWPNNPFNILIDKYKKELATIQSAEQKSMSSHANDDTKSPFPMVDSCISCHEEQGKFWQSTPHSIAYLTLVKSEAQHNSECIGCHSLGFKDERGFLSTHNVFAVEKDSTLKIESYLNELKTLVPKKAVRALQGKERVDISKTWAALDMKYSISQNFANVQCLHCHQKPSDHPFDMNSKDNIKGVSKNQCLKCHTSDQSPEWYTKKDSSLAGELNSEYVEQQMKKVSCPKSKNDE